MAVGKERYEKNVLCVGMAPSIHEGYGYLYLLGQEGMMYYYEYAKQENGDVRDLFVREVMAHCMTLDGVMRISFVFATNIIHSLSQIVHPHLIGMNAELDPLEGSEEEEEKGKQSKASEDEDLAEDADIPDDFGFPDDEPEEEDNSPWGRGGSFGGAVVTQDDPSIALAGTESVPHEAVGSVDQIADTPIPFELWLFSIKKLGQNMVAATEHYERMDDAQKEELQQEYNATFGL